jgi:hypothetical protein
MSSLGHIRDRVVHADRCPPARYASRDPVKATINGGGVAFILGQLSSRMQDGSRQRAQSRGSQHVLRSGLVAPTLIRV